MGVAECTGRSPVATTLLTMSQRAPSASSITKFANNTRRRNAIAVELPYKSTVDVRRWCQFQLIRAQTPPGESYAEWRTACRQAAASNPLSYGLDFDSLSLDADSLIASVVDRFRDLQLLDMFAIDASALVAFLADIRRGYHDANAYHNFHHAVDVFQMALHIVMQGDAISSLTPRCLIVILVSALVHDLDHPSLRALPVDVNLELHHAIQADRLLSNHPAILRNVDEPNVVRAQIIECILATNIGLEGQWRQRFDATMPAMLMQLVIRCADISNVCRPARIAAKWSQALHDEIRGESRVEPFSKETTVRFCQNIALPTFQILSDTWPRASNCLASLQDNIATWTA